MAIPIAFSLLMKIEDIELQSILSENFLWIWKKKKG